MKCARIRSSGRSIWANEAGPMTNSQNLALDVTALSAGYGRFDVVHDIALKVAKGEAVALLGPNGAGKTTVLKSIMGLVSQRSGSIRVAGEDVSAFPAHRVARGFAAIAPEGRRLFLDQTVEDNLLLGGLHLRRDRGRLQALLKSVYDLFPVLYKYRRRLSSYLSGGEQQMVAIGRLLMSLPWRCLRSLSASWWMRCSNCGNGARRSYWSNSASMSRCAFATACT